LPQERRAAEVAVSRRLTVAQDPPGLPELSERGPPRPGLCRRPSRSSPAPSPASGLARRLRPHAVIVERLLPLAFHERDLRVVIHDQANGIERRRAET